MDGWVGSRSQTQWIFSIDTFLLTDKNPPESHPCVLACYDLAKAYVVILVVRFDLRARLKLECCKIDPADLNVSLVHITWSISCQNQLSERVPFCEIIPNSISDLKS